MKESFVLLDVGCAGGIDMGWTVLGDRLQAYGFDPSIAEVERLSAANANPRVKYVCGFVGAPEDSAVRRPEPGIPMVWRDPTARMAWRRSQTLADARARGEPPPPRSAIVEVGRNWDGAPPMSLCASDVAASAGAYRVVEGDEAEMMSQNNWYRTALADPAKPIILADFLAEEGVDSVDFIKIDTDGSDFEILASLEATLRDRQVLAVAAEVNFIGGAASNQHTFHNTDRFMRAQGFDLAHLSVRRYSSAALPFTYSAPHPHYGRAINGRPYQGDAIYVRDLGFTDTHPSAAGLSDDKLLKLAAILALFGRVDHAAEVLLMFRDRLAGRLDIDAALDLLTQELHALEGAPLNDRAPATYAEHMARFEADNPEAYNGDWDRLVWPHLLVANSQVEISQLRQEVALITGSLSWRLTAPLRRLARLLRR